MSDLCRAPSRDHFAMKLDNQSPLRASMLGGITPLVVVECASSPVAPDLRTRLLAEQRGWSGSGELHEGILVPPPDLDTPQYDVRARLTAQRDHTMTTMPIDEEIGGNNVPNNEALFLGAVCAVSMFYCVKLTVQNYNRATFIVLFN
ncbi:hypothetical protein ElyMa_006836000 [Elysia marginata]|uniref:Uncharacterized protein n=1 Tax=Elysia marginata TaxID=1093978 RepID=A0AAV4J9F2_9GAST|nr:hypothetical protein ElyMa_006836000 [Elysia marginata]